MAKYRKKPVVVDAEQWNPKDPEHWPGAGTPDKFGVVWEFDTNCTLCQGHMDDTITGGSIVRIGDWIIIYDNGEKDVLTPKEFEHEYEKVEEK